MMTLALAMQTAARFECPPVSSWWTDPPAALSVGSSTLAEIQAKYLTVADPAWGERYQLKTRRGSDPVIELYFDSVRPNGTLRAITVQFSRFPDRTERLGLPKELSQRFPSERFEDWTWSVWPDDGIAAQTMSGRLYGLVIAEPARLIPVLARTSETPTPLQEFPARAEDWIPTVRYGDLSIQSSSGAPFAGTPGSGRPFAFDSALSGGNSGGIQAPNYQSPFEANFNGVPSTGMASYALGMISKAALTNVPQHRFLQFRKGDAGRFQLDVRTVFQPGNNLIGGQGSNRGSTGSFSGALLGTGFLATVNAEINTASAVGPIRARASSTSWALQPDAAAYGAAADAVRRIEANIRARWKRYEKPNISTPRMASLDGVAATIALGTTIPEPVPDEAGSDSSS